MLQSTGDDGSFVPPCFSALDSVTYIPGSCVLCWLPQLLFGGQSGWIAAGVMTVPFTHSALITTFSGFCLRRCFVSAGPLQPLHGEPADFCGQQRGRVRPAGAEDAGTVPASYLCWQHLWAQWVHFYMCQSKVLVNPNHITQKTSMHWFDLVKYWRFWIWKNVGKHTARGHTVTCAHCSLLCCVFALEGSLEMMESWSQLIKM